MSSAITPQEIRAEFGLREPPFALNAFREYYGVRFVLDSGVRSGGATIWRPDAPITVSLPPATVERKREDGSHELGHVAYGDVGPDRPVLYRRGRGRSAELNPQIEERATGWGIDALIGEGPLRIALFHEEIKSVGELARKFLVASRFMTEAAVRYGLGAFLLRHPDAYAKYLRTAEWIRRSSEILAARPVCERPCCGRPAVAVQHRRYDTLGHERVGDVESLCLPCYSGVNLGLDVSARQLSLLPPPASSFAS